MNRTAIGMWACIALAMLSLIGSLVLLQMSAARTARAQERIAATEEEETRAFHEPRISATWPHGVLVMGLDWPYMDKAEFRAELAACLREWEPKEN